MAQGGKFDVFDAQSGGGMSGSFSRRNKWILILFFLIIAALGGYLFFQRSFGTDPQAETGLITETSPLGTSSVFSRPSSGAPSDPVPLFGGTNYQSENFRVGDIAIGGEAEFLLTEDTPEPIAINAIRGESFTEKNKEEVKLVLSWKTNKLARSEIIYSKGLGQAKKSVNEEDYSLSHSLIIPGLDQASTYIYTITSHDRFGNTITSDPHAVYTGSRTVSLFDLIADAVSDVFGWAVKK